MQGQIFLREKRFWNLESPFLHIKSKALGFGSLFGRISKCYKESISQMEPLITVHSHKMYRCGLNAYEKFQFL